MPVSGDHNVHGDVQGPENRRGVRLRQRRSDRSSRIFRRLLSIEQQGKERFDAAASGGPIADGRTIVQRLYRLQRPMRRCPAVRRRSRRPAARRRPLITMLMMPALRTRLPSASWSSVAAIRPFWKSSIWTQGLRRPVISTTALSPRCSRVPVGSASRSMPDVVMFSPSSPGCTAKPLLAQFVEQFGMDQMHLTQIGLGRILADARAVLDRRRPYGRRRRRQAPSAGGCQGSASC